ncbi:MAG TPA: SMI1/KNR4 family protein [Candidatus Acidoferrum sp.]|nr:SMI1/KNR4 family protein [Candidatus Acidoferrum sp.]
MRRFEFKEGSSNKFWEVTVSKNTLTVRFGRVGSAGQEKSKTFATPALAQKEQDKLIAEKQGKGYKEVEAPSSAKDVPPVATIKPAGPVSDVLVRLDKWLSANRPDYYGKLLRGASPAELDAFEKKFHLQLPSGFRELYRWRSGQDPNCSASLQHTWMFSRLEDLSDSKETLDGMIGFDFEDPKWWRRGWIPFLSNGGGDHLCLDLTAEDGGAPGQLLTFYHDWEKRAVEYPSVQAWLTELVESMENGTLELS